MTKQLYEEALADVKKVKQVAEDNAKRAILDAVTPQIRAFIDQAILEQADGSEEDIGPGTPPGLGGAEQSAAPVAPGAAPEKGELMVDLVSVDPRAQVPVDAAGPAAAITPPDAQGKVTLDIDSLCSTGPGAPVPPPMFGEPAPKEEEPEYEISLESIEALQPIASVAKKPALPAKDIKGQIAKINERVNLLKSASKAVRSTPAFNEHIAQLISRVENMYDYVQERIADPATKSSYETMLEASFKDLNTLQESTTMSQNKQGQMNEADVTLKLTGLPDDIDLDTVGVDLITGEEDEEGGQGEELGGGLEDMGGEQMPGQGEEQQMETRKLSDDTIVEIDEKMLRREIARMRNLREEHTGTGGSETKANSWGNGSGDANILDDFGGGKDEGEFDDQEIVDKSPSPGANPLGEADGEDLDEKDNLDERDDQMDEADDLDEQSMPPAPSGGSMPGMDELEEAGTENSEGYGRRRADAIGEKEAQGHPSLSHTQEARKRLGFEKKLQERARERAAALKKAAKVAHSKKDAKRFNECKKEYQVIAQRFNESVSRAKKLSQIVAEATKKQQESRSNSGTAQPAENQAENASLRKKLAETNLFNAKLLYTNKLLQNEQLTTRQKAQVIKQLDSAKTVREAKLVYDSLAGALAGSAPKTVNESADRKVLGSGSRATRPASTQQSLNEGYEAERWAQLAGITKR